ncbi:MAG: response regulator transcription factor [Clostridia bacterium]|nr:response regulator transcription factor [Clostridia bacterium]
MYRIFVVEDDAALAEAIAAQLTGWGHEVICARDFRNIAEEFAKSGAHLVLMDVALPFFSGYHWCQEIRRESQAPIVFLSSAAEDLNIVMAMGMGGDDFIKKPVAPEVLAAKVGAVLRRAYGMGRTGALLTHRGALLDLDAGILVAGGERVELTKNEFRILRTLMEQKGRIVSREQLMISLWQMDDYVEENTLTANVTRLRRKLDSVGLTDFIQTRVGQGYMIPVEEGA